MTNAQIIFNQSIELMNKGIIGTTGRKIKVTYQKNGEEVTEIINEPEEIHTFAEWKNRGYFVRKGEKAKAQFTIWKYSSKTKKLTGEEVSKINSIAEGINAAEGDEIETDGRYFMKMSFFFTKDQTTAAEKMLPAVI